SEVPERRRVSRRGKVDGDRPIAAVEPAVSTDRVSVHVESAGVEVECGSGHAASARIDDVAVDIRSAAVDGQNCRRTRVGVCGGVGVGELPQRDAAGGKDSGCGRVWSTPAERDRSGSASRYDSTAAGKRTHYDRAVDGERSSIKRDGALNQYIGLLRRSCRHVDGAQMDV